MKRPRIYLSTLERQEADDRAALEIGCLLSLVGGCVLAALLAYGVVVVR